MEESLFRKICNTLPVGILLVTEKGSVEWINDYFFKLFKIKREDCKSIKSLFNKIFPPIKKKLLLTDLNLDYKIFCTVKKIKFKDQGFLVYTFESVENVEETQKRIILEALPNPVWLISETQIIIAQNKAAKRIFGTEEGQYCWEGIWKMKFLSDSKKRFYKVNGYPLPGTKCIFCKADMALQTGQNIKIEVQLEHKTWETWWLPVKKNLYVYFANDITEHKKIQEEFYKLSIVDTLTGAYNRRYFLKKIKEELERVKRGGLPFSLAIFDIDKFKLVNDTYGHQTGDLVLKELVNLINSRIRKTDLLARWGGEEFVLLLIDTHLHQAVVLIEELRKLIESCVFKEVKHITVSFGVTQCLKEDSVNSIISRADNLMYQAKRSGRNCVKFG